jgi:hypothetical protein
MSSSNNTGSSPQCWSTSVTLTLHAADHVNQFPRILDTISTSTRPVIHFVTRLLYTSCYCHASQAVWLPCLYRGLSLTLISHLPINNSKRSIPAPSIVFDLLRSPPFLLLLYLSLAPTHFALTKSSPRTIHELILDHPGWPHLLTPSQPSNTNLLRQSSILLPQVQK